MESDGDFSIWSNKEVPYYLDSTYSKCGAMVTHLLAHARSVLYMGDRSEVAVSTLHSPLLNFTEASLCFYQSLGFEPLTRLCIT